MSVIATCNLCGVVRICSESSVNFLQGLVDDGWLLYYALSFCSEHNCVVTDNMEQNEIPAITVDVCHASGEEYQVYRCADGRRVKLDGSSYCKDVNVGNLVAISIVCDHYVAKKVDVQGSSASLSYAFTR